MGLVFALSIAAGQAFVCTPVAVWDGDGPIWCKEGPKVRLAGIATREIDDRCLPQHPCPAAGGQAARDALVRLVGKPTGVGRFGHIEVNGPPLRCWSVGSGKGSRTAAWCSTERGVDLSCALVRMRVAVRWMKYDGARVCNSRR